MERIVQVKGTLPLIADYLNTNEKRIYEIFGLKQEEREQQNNEQKGGGQCGITNQSKTISSSESSI